METLVPAFLVLHVFGILLWFGSTLVQYVFLSEDLQSDNLSVLRWVTALIQKLNRQFSNVGLSVAIVTGVLIILAHGMEWFRPRIYVHLKMGFGVVAAGLTHMAMSRLRRAAILLNSEVVSDADRATFKVLARSWRSFAGATAALLILNLVLAIFKFGV
jgi:uncharacterized membrane protein